VENFEPLFHPFDVDFGEQNIFMIFTTPSVSNYKSFLLCALRYATSGYILKHKKIYILKNKTTYNLEWRK